MYDWYHNPSRQAMQPRRQRGGSGLGGILSSFARSMAPIMKRGLVSVGKTALNTGKHILDDYTHGGDLKTSLKRRGKESLNNLLTDAFTISIKRIKLKNARSGNSSAPIINQSGRKKTSIQKRKKKTTRRTSPTDIFS